jgi:hypothetical protein
LGQKPQEEKGRLSCVGLTNLLDLAFAARILFQGPLKVKSFFLTTFVEVFFQVLPTSTCDVLQQGLFRLLAA